MWLRLWSNVVQCGPYCGFSIVQFVVQVWSKLCQFFSTISGPMWVKCGPSENTKIDPYWSSDLGFWSNCVPKWDLNVVQIMVQLWLKSWPRIFFQLWSRWFKCGPYVVQCGPYCGFSVVQIVVQVWSKLFTFVSGFHTYVNFFQHLVVQCGSSVVQMKMQRLTHF